jgi:hypothetical protein
MDIVGALKSGADAVKRGVEAGVSSVKNTVAGARRKRHTKSGRKHKSVRKTRKVSKGKKSRKVNKGKKSRSRK